MGGKCREGRALPGEEGAGEAPLGPPGSSTGGTPAVPSLEHPLRAFPQAPPSAPFLRALFPRAAALSGLDLERGRKKDILSSWHLSSKQIAQRVPSVDILCTNRK